MTLGKRIKAARERLDPRPTQGDIGAALDVSDKAVSGWENDKYVPEPDKMPKLRRELRVSYLWLMEGNGPPPAPDAPEVILDDLGYSAPPEVRASLAKAIAGIRKQR